MQRESQHHPLIYCSPTNWTASLLVCLDHYDCKIPARIDPVAGIATLRSNEAFYAETDYVTSMGIIYIASI